MRKRKYTKRRLPAGHNRVASILIELATEAEGQQVKAQPMTLDTEYLQILDAREEVANGET